MPSAADPDEEQYPLRPSRESQDFTELLEDDFVDAGDAEALGHRKRSKTENTRNLLQVLYQIAPLKVKRILDSIHDWLEGPDPPRPFRIRPLAPKLQLMPQNLADSVTNRLRIHWLILWSLLFAVLFIIILARSESVCKIDPYGTPLRLSCVDRLWRGSSACGLDGLKCQPFDNSTFAFRCPATCETVKVLEPYYIGNRTINYQSLIVGGGSNATHANIYRGDSFICPAAIHAGLFPARSGGSGIIKLIGEYSNFTGVSSNGLQGIDFHSSFPQSYTFDREDGTNNDCSDPRWAVMTLTVIYTAVVSLCFAAPSQFYSTAFVSAYFCIALAADAPEPSSFYTVVSLAFRGFLPAAFVGYVIYRFMARYSLEHLDAPFDRTILWLGPFWVGALDNMTFDLLPLQRLTPHDLMEPGAISVLIAIALVILIAALGQVWAFRIEGKLITYLKFYMCLGTAVTGLLLIPGLNLRLHHYILALLLLPGTAMQTRPSLVYQGLLVGLFINGIARWGFDSILQTSGDLFATDLDGLIPQIQLPQVSGDKITFTWSAVVTGYNGISVLVNDVERYRAYGDQFSKAFTWKRMREDEDTYFRFGFVKYGRIQDSSVGRYSNPGTWLGNGSWIPVDPDEHW